MRKLHLKLETLEVESFPVAKEGAARGTVHGNSGTQNAFSCKVDTCSGGMLCACGTFEYTYCGTCVTDEISYCVAC